VSHLRVRGFREEEKVLEVEKLLLCQHLQSCASSQSTSGKRQPWHINNLPTIRSQVVGGDYSNAAAIMTTTPALPAYIALRFDAAPM
jgi:hypothetical protein